MARIGDTSTRLGLHTRLASFIPLSLRLGEAMLRIATGLVNTPYELAGHSIMKSVPLLEVAFPRCSSRPFKAREAHVANTN